MILRLGLVASALAASFALPAQAACTKPPPPQVPHYDVCTRDGNPTCVYGHLFISHFESRWC